jgi:hypothetical protein
VSFPEALEASRIASNPARYSSGPRKRSGSVRCEASWQKLRVVHRPPHGRLSVVITVGVKPCLLSSLRISVQAAALSRLGIATLTLDGVL